MFFHFESHQRPHACTRKKLHWDLSFIAYRIDFSENVTKIVKKLWKFAKSIEHLTKLKMWKRPSNNPQSISFLIFYIVHLHHFALISMNKKFWSPPSIVEGKCSTAGLGTSGPQAICVPLSTLMWPGVGVHKTIKIPLKILSFRK